MLANVVADFLDSVTEREFDVPLMALLRSHGYRDIHLVHGSYEFGKDVIAKLDELKTTTQYALQSKAGDIGLADWASMRGQLDLLRTSNLAHPSFDTDLLRVGVLVLTGRLIGGAALDAQDYKQRLQESRDTPLEIWDRDDLIGLFCASPDAGLAGAAEGPLLEIVAHIDSRQITEIELEEYSTRWIEIGQPLQWRSVLEAAAIGTRLRVAERLDLACFTSLALLRAVWASAHKAEQVSDVFHHQASLARDMFMAYASEVWEMCTEDLLDSAEFAYREPEGIFLTYPVTCLRIAEIVGLYGLKLDEGGQSAVAAWLDDFMTNQPGATHPVSDRWAVSLLPPLLLLHRHGARSIAGALTSVVKWLGDRHDGELIGLASYHADPAEEAEYLLGGSLEHIERPKRRTSYLAALVLDLAAAFELADVYDLAYNDLAAVELTPLVPLPNDDAAQYLVAGRGANVPLNTSPHYAESFAEGEDWRMASHHDEQLDRYLLGRIGELWDALALSIVTRDRHWVALLRML